MADMGLSSGEIARILTGYFNKTGQKEEFTPKSILNLIVKHQKEIDLLHGIDTDFSIAQKTLATLNECVTIASLLYVANSLFVVNNFFVCSRSLAWEFLMSVSQWTKMATCLCTRTKVVQQRKRR